MATNRSAALWLAAVTTWLGCADPRATTGPEAGATAPSPSISASTPSPAAPADAGAPFADASPGATRVTLIAGGDVSYGRLRGQRLLREPERNDLSSLSSLLDSATLRFVNLESTISDQQGETQSPQNKLVFTAPPLAAAALKRAQIDIVALANNHAWDYGKDALIETFAHLEGVQIPYVGAGRSRAEAYGPRLIRRNGFTLAFLAVTGSWNQEIDPHPGKGHVADAQVETLVASVKQAKALTGVDKVIVSYHGGYEYFDRPHPATRELLAAAITAGADAVIGHHPHVVQRIGFVAGKPILYSLGNLLMRMVTGKPWTEIGVLARLTFHREAATTVEICPFRIFGFDQIPLAADPNRSAQEALLRVKLERLLRIGALVDPDQAASLGAFGSDGCAPVTPRAPRP
jgi:poly-gamma-glutamate capsule biosynthesis protein CapA/YwtB (metallophosphatase superfamily)